MNKAFFNDIRNEILNQISSAKKEINIANGLVYESRFT